jgi:integrative and conjugative element protein (TIGR02256 family)
MSNEWKMDVPDYGLVRVSEELITKLTEYCQLGKEAPESGGVLIGKHLNSGGMILVDDFTPPQDTDKQGRCLYHRSAEHSEIASKIWKDTDGHSTYLGLWHTHPEPIPDYSYTDEQDWLNALNKSKYEGERLYFFIVGQTHIRCWLGTKIKRKYNIELLGEYEIE